MSFAKLARLAHQHRVQLSATGFYRTPKIWYDRARARGRPFYYFAYGAAVSEVVVDTLTGEYRVLRADLLHDVGRSINPALDLGQIEGGFVQGMGWLTTEELCWNERGELDHARALDLQDPDGERPAGRFSGAHLGEGHQSRAGGRTLKGGRRAAADARHLGVPRDHPTRSPAWPAAASRPALDAPATPERVLLAIEDLKRRAGTAAPAAAQAAE